MNLIQQVYYFGAIKCGEFTLAEEINDYLCILCSQDTKIIKIDNIAFPSDNYPTLGVIITYELTVEE